MSLLQRIDSRRARLRQTERMQRSGRVSRAAGLAVESIGPPASIGEVCMLLDHNGEPRSELQVVGFEGGRLLSMPLESVDGMRPGDRIIALGRTPEIPVGSDMLGRVLDGRGAPLDDGDPFQVERFVPIENDAPAPMDRESIFEPLQTGVRAIDGPLTIGLGQRIGVFAGSGVGKSTLLGMLTRGMNADVCVFALVGERGREVRDFIERDLGPEALKRSVIFVSTSEEPPMCRLRAILAATAAAEFFRDQGRDVLLMVDSLTRVAMAQREIGLSVGEPPSSKGYPPSVQALLPKILERAGKLRRGSITGIYSVYIEGDDIQDPIGDAARSLLDGHITLSRRLASRGHYPSIDLLDSVSRLMPFVSSEKHQEAARTLRKTLATLTDVEELVSLGAYKPGTLEEYDRALAVKHDVESFLQQPVTEPSSFEDTQSRLAYLAAAASGHTAEVA